MKTKLWFTYMVECRDGTIYTGATTDVKRRVSEHNSGRGAKYTRSRGPVLLRYQVEFANRSNALRWEAYLKSLPRAEKLERIRINGTNAIGTALRH